jgi:hypothetical protein
MKTKLRYFYLSHYRSKRPAETVNYLLISLNIQYRLVLDRAGASLNAA